MGDYQGFDDQGFDDQFNDGLFQTTLHSSRRERPNMWPKSVSEMRGHTSYGDQQMIDPYADGSWHSDFQLRRGPALTYGGAGQPAFWRDSGNPREGCRPAAENGGHWLHQPYGAPIWFSPR